MVNEPIIKDNTLNIMKIETYRNLLENSSKEERKKIILSIIDGPESDNLKNEPELLSLLREYRTELLELKAENDYAKKSAHDKTLKQLQETGSPSSNHIQVKCIKESEVIKTKLGEDYFFDKFILQPAAGKTPTKRIVCGFLLFPIKEDGKIVEFTEKIVSFEDNDYESLFEEIKN